MTETMTLYKIEETLQELLDIREQAAVDGDTDAIEAIEAQMQGYFSREIRKVDGIAAAVRHYAAAAIAAREEADRLIQRSKRFQATVDRIKEHAKKKQWRRTASRNWRRRPAHCGFR